MILLFAFGNHIRRGAILLAAMTTLWPAVVTAETIRIGGTGAVYGLFKILAEPYARLAPDDRLELIPSLGSAGGIAAAHAGMLDLVVSGREPNEAERNLGLVMTPLLESPFLFATATREPMALRRSDVLRIFNGDLLRWPDGTLIRLILRPRKDSQVQLMTEQIEGMKAAFEKARQRPELSLAPSDKDNMEAANAMDGSFGGFPLIQLLSEPNRLKPVRLDGIEPGVEAMKAGTYPLKARYILLTTATPSAGARRFMAFLATPEARAIIEKAGGVPLGPVRPDS